MEYNYKKIQEMRGILFEEMKELFGSVLNVEHMKLLEMRLQTAIMAGLLDSDIKEEVPDTRVVDTDVLKAEELKDDV